MSAGLAVLVSAGAGIVAAISGALVGAYVSARTAKKLDELTRGREDRRHEADLQAAAAFVRADMKASRRRLKTARDKNEWWPYYRLPTAAWREHGPIIAAYLHADEVSDVAQAFAHLEEFGESMAMSGTQKSMTDTILPANFAASTDFEGFEELIDLTSKALFRLEQIAPHRNKPQIDDSGRLVDAP